MNTFAKELVYSTVQTGHCDGISDSDNNKRGEERRGEANEMLLRMNAKMVSYLPNNKAPTDDVRTSLHLTSLHLT
jgi:hypothetical protein